MLNIDILLFKKIIENRLLALVNFHNRVFLEIYHRIVNYCALQHVVETKFQVDIVGNWLRNMDKELGLSCVLLYKVLALSLREL